MARDKLHLQRYTVADGLPHNIINSIIEDSEGDIWIATWNGFCRWHNHTIVAYTETMDHQRIGRISDIWDDGDGHIGYRDESGDYFLFDPKVRMRVKTKVPYKPLRKRNFRYTLEEDKQGIAIRHNRITYRIPYDENNRTESRPRAFFEDSKGRLWFNFNGVLYMATFVASPFFHFTSTSETGIPFEATVRSICCNKQGRLLLGTRNAQLHGLTEHPLNLSDNPYSIIEDQASRLWIAMRDSGICIIPESCTHTKNRTILLKGTPLFSLLNIPDAHEIWAGSWGKGIYIFKDNNKIKNPTDTILVNTHIHSIHRCSDGNIAVCTQNGLRIVHLNKRIICATDTTLNVICAIETQDKEVIFSTMGKGLYSLSLSETNVNPVIHEIKIPYDDVIMDMLYDSKGYLWMIADTRLFRFRQVSDAPEVFDSNDFGKDLTFTEAASCLYGDSLLYLGVTPGMLEINLNELDSYVQSRNQRLAAEKVHTQQQWLFGILAVAMLTAFIILLFLWQRKKKQHTIEITLRKPIVEDNDNDFIEKLTSTLQQHLEDADVDMERIAKSLGMTRNAFYRRCREVMNSTPAALLQDMRIERACQLLREGEKRVKEVAWKSGFTDAKYFAKVFKSKKGVTPTEYIVKMECREGK